MEFLTLKENGKWRLCGGLLGEEEEEGKGNVKEPHWRSRTVVNCAGVPICGCAHAMPFYKYCIIIPS